MRYLVISLLFFTGLAHSYAQNPAQSDIGPSAQAMVEVTGDCVYLDSEQKVCYVDLEMVRMNLKQAVLINKRGDEVVVKDLMNTPVNSIVELDYSHLPAGSYLLELRSYTGTAHKTVRL